MLYFLHIPKTAGTSVRAALSDNFPASAIAPIMHPRELLCVPPVELRNYQLIAGHFGYGLKGYLNTELDVITFLRRPLDQALSMFFDHKAHGFLDSECTLGDVIDSKYIQLLLNLQSRWLACDDLSTRNTGYDLFYPHRDLAIQELTKRSLLEKARRRLASMTVVGIVEQFGESMRLICDRFGWPVRADWPVLNVQTNRNRDLVNERDKQRLSALLSLDEELYQSAKELFFDALSENRRSGCNYYRDRLGSEPPVATRLVTFDQALHGSGWHQRELLADGRHGRWTGPGRISSLQLRLCSDRDLLISMFISRAIVPENVKELRMRLNGCELPIRFFPSANESCDSVLCTAEAQRSVLARDEVAILEIEVARVCRPSDLDEKSTDERPLGIMVSWLCITPLGEAHLGEND